MTGPPLKLDDLLGPTTPAANSGELSLDALLAPPETTTEADVLLRQYEQQYQRKVSPNVVRAERAATQSEINRTRRDENVLTESAGFAKTAGGEAAAFFKHLVYPTDESGKLRGIPVFTPLGEMLLAPVFALEERRASDVHSTLASAPPELFDRPLGESIGLPQVQQYFHEVHRQQEALKELRVQGLAFIASLLTGGAAGVAAKGLGAGATSQAVATATTGAAVFGGTYPILRNPDDPANVARAVGLGLASIPLGLVLGATHLAKTYYGERAGKIQGALDKAIRTHIDIAGNLARADAIAQLRQALPFEVAPEVEPRIANATIRESESLMGALDILGEQTNIKMRLFSEQYNNLESVIVRAKAALNPNGTTIIPGLDYHPEQLKDYHGLVEDEVATYRRPDGLIDVALFGENSPLQETLRRKQFERTGYFVGQEVSWKGKRYSVHNLDNSNVGVELEAVHGNTRAFVPLSELRRPPYTESSIPFAAEARYRKYTQQEAAEHLALVTLPDEVRADFIKDQRLFIDASIRAAIRAEPGAPLYPLPAGLSVHQMPSLRDRSIASTEIILPREDYAPTLYVWSNPDGQAIATMALDFKPTFGEGTNSLSIDALFVDRAAHPVQQGRALVEFARIANELKVNQIAQRVDVMGAKVAAHFVNKYFEPLRDISKVRARIGVTPVTLDAVHKDFQAFSEKIEANGDTYAPKQSAFGPNIPNILQPPDVNHLRKGPFAGAWRAAQDAAYGVPPEEMVNAATEAFVDRMKEDSPRTPVPPEHLQSVQGYFNWLQNFDLWRSWDKRVEAFARARGFLPEETYGLKRYLEFKEGKRLRELHLTPEEREIFDALQTKLATQAPTLVTAGKVVAEGAQLPLELDVMTNGYTLDVSPSGSYLLRDQKTGEVLYTANTADGAREFVNRSGQANGPHLDGGGINNNIPIEGVTGGNIPPGGAPPKVNQVGDLPPDGSAKMQALTNYVRGALLRWMEPYQGQFLTFDNLYNTRMQPGWLAMQQAVNRLNHALTPWHARVEALDKIGNGLSKERRDIVGRWQQTLSSKEIIEGGIVEGRTPSVEVIATARDLASRGVDTSKATKYARLLEEIDGSKMSAAEKLVASDELRHDMVMSPDELRAADVYADIRKRDINGISELEVSMLTNALMDEAKGIKLDRQGFAADNKMTSQELALGRASEVLFADLAKELKIPDYRRLRHYLAHYKIDPGNFLSNNALMGQTDVKFASELVRTGELDAYELDPVSVAMRYVTSAFKSKELLPTWNAVQKLFEGELAKIPVESRGQATRVVQAYLGEMRGFPQEAVKMTQAVTDRVIKDLRIPVSVDVSRTLVNLSLGMVSSATMAFRPGMAARDFTQNTFYYFTRFGPSRTGRFLTMKTSPELVESLKAMGVVGEFNPYTVTTPLESAASAYTRGLRNVAKWSNTLNKIGLDTSLQRQAYNWQKSAAYLETREFVGEQITKADLSNGSYTREQAYDAIKLDTYEPPVQKEFKRLLQSNADEAIHYLASQTAEDAIASYGQGYRPPFWNNSVGRLGGQFFNWSSWARDQFLRTISYGSKGRRVAAIARFTMTQMALKGIEISGGFGLSSWYFLPGMLWTGGPLFNSAFALVQAFSNPSQRESGAAQNLLEKMLPWNGIKHFYYPGSWAIQDWATAINEPNLTPLQRVSQAVGVKAVPQ